MWSVAEMASKILRRVLSARAFDIFSTSERFMLNLECSEVVVWPPQGKLALCNSFRKTCNR
jgi:hypothetical protein